MITLIITN